MHMSQRVVGALHKKELSVNSAAPKRAVISYASDCVGKYFLGDLEKGGIIRYSRGDGILKM